jgi:hypothetical protein
MISIIITKLKAHLHLVLKLRMCGFVPPLAYIIIARFLSKYSVQFFLVNTVMNPLVL